MNDNIKNGNNQNQFIADQVQPTKKYPSGIMRGIFFFPMGILLSILIGIASGQSIGTLWGVIIGILVFMISVIITVTIINRSKTLTVVDCLLPFLISLISAFVFSPVAIFSGNAFSIGTSIFSGVLLSVGLYLYKNDKIHGVWLIWPFLTFIYEILPIDLPTDLDNILALGVGTLDLVTGGLLRKQSLTNNQIELETEETIIENDQYAD